MSHLHDGHVWKCHRSCRQAERASAKCAATPKELLGLLEGWDRQTMTFVCCCWHCFISPSICHYSNCKDSDNYPFVLFTSPNWTPQGYTTMQITLHRHHCWGN
jgi:hypothetical protein